MKPWSSELSPNSYRVAFTFNKLLVQQLQSVLNNRYSSHGSLYPWLPTTIYCFYSRFSHFSPVTWLDFSCSTAVSEIHYLNQLNPNRRSESPQLCTRMIHSSKNRVTWPEMYDRTDCSTLHIVGCGLALNDRRLLFPFCRMEYPHSFQVSFQHSVQNKTFTRVRLSC